MVASGVKGDIKKIEETISKVISTPKHTSLLTGGWVLLNVLLAYEQAPGEDGKKFRSARNRRIRRTKRSAGS